MPTRVSGELAGEMTKQRQSASNKARNNRAGGNKTDNTTAGLVKEMGENYRPDRFVLSKDRKKVIHSVNERL